MTANAASGPAQERRPGGSFWSKLVGVLDRLGFTPLGAFLVILLALLPGSRCSSKNTTFVG
jgi:hypothetical protein